MNINLPANWKWRNPLGSSGGPPRTRPEQRTSQGGGQESRIVIGWDGRPYAEITTPGVGPVLYAISESPEGQFYPPQSNQVQPFRQQTQLIPGSYQPPPGTERPRPPPREQGSHMGNDVNPETQHGNAFQSGGGASNHGGQQELPPGYNQPSQVHLEDQGTAPTGSEPRYLQNQEHPQNISTLRYPDQEHSQNGSTQRSPDDESSHTGSSSHYQESQYTGPPGPHAAQQGGGNHTLQPQNHSYSLIGQENRMVPGRPAAYREHSGSRGPSNVLQRKTVSYSALETEIKLYKKTISDKDKAITSLREERDKLDKSNTDLVKEISVHTEKNRTLTKENESYKGRNISLNGEKRTLIEQLHTVKTERNSARQEVHKLNQRRTADEQKINGLDDVINNLRDLNQGLEKEVAKLNAQIVGLRHDNDEIRSYIIKMESDLLPVKDEDYYIQLFEGIKSEVEMWSAKHGKSNAGATLSQEHEEQLLNAIACLGNSGTASVEFLRANPRFFRAWYSNARSLIQLIRHVIAVFLYDKIFEPFAAGLPTPFSRSLVWIGNDVIQHEPQFSKTLMFHQALGLGAVRYVDKHYPQYNELIINEMSILLTLLLPNVSSDAINKAATKFITKALALKAAMTKEQAVYHGYCAYGGSDFDPESMHIASEETGPVFLCTFPGLARTIKKENERGKETIRTVRASVVLQSALQSGNIK